MRVLDRVRRSASSALPARNCWWHCSEQKSTTIPSTTPRAAARRLGHAHAGRADDDCVTRSCRDRPFELGELTARVHLVRAKPVGRRIARTPRRLSPTRIVQGRQARGARLPSGDDPCAELHTAVRQRRSVLDDQHGLALHDIRPVQSHHAVRLEARCRWGSARAERPRVTIQGPSVIPRR